MLVEQTVETVAKGIEKIPSKERTCEFDADESLAHTGETVAVEIEEELGAAISSRRAQETGMAEAGL